jgi:hypothetical protein
MVGFKSIALLISLLILGACIPQTKQTDCASNQAFNAVLRTCVPVMNGPSSFIDITSFLPTSVLSKYKNDPTPLTFSVLISNPYAQTYTVEWERVYNGSPISVTGSTSGSYSSYTLSPLMLATQLGTHIISVKIKDSTGSIVDSHNFEVKINDTPKPIILTNAFLIPPTYNNDFTPLTPVQNFGFEVFNNGATMFTGTSTPIYKTEWRLYRGGILINTSTTTFPTAGGSLASSGSNFPTYAFNSGALGVGAYLLNARVTNTSSEVVAEQQWSVTVAHPPLSPITGRDIYDLTTAPQYNTPSIAYTGVPYTGSPTYNFIPSTVTTPAVGAQGNYCVTVADPSGTYPTDLFYVRVNFYTDGGTFVYSGLTSPGDNKVCLSDSSNLSAVVFNNAAPDSTVAHTLNARVWDEATGKEYTAADMPGLGNYPITWDFTVKPQNQAPVVAFGVVTGSTLANCSATSPIKTGCTVASDTNFKVKINFVSDDFYTLPANEAQFDYSIRLYRNGVNIQTCTKAGYSVPDPLLTGAPDTNGADGYDCELRINSYNASGPINLNSYSYQIQAEITDLGSPITSVDKASTTLTWSFAPNGVSETNTVPVISGWSAGNAVEGNVVGTSSPISFSAVITDNERDNFTYTIKYCANPTCTSTVALTSGTIIRTSDAVAYTLVVPVNVPEDFLLGITGLGCHTTKRNQTCVVPFFIEVKDIPNTAAPLTATSGQFNSTITNYNALPVLNANYSNPVPSLITYLTANAFVGFPISIFNNPTSILTDTSAVTTEKTFRYQWYAKNSSSFVSPWQPIQGSTGNNLMWTPSHVQNSTDDQVSFMICAEDQPTSAVSSVNLTDSICSHNPAAVSPAVNLPPWVVKVHNNIAKHDLSTSSSTELASIASDAGKETAVWYETPSSFNGVLSSAAYVAMIGNDKQIYVKKILVKDRAGLDTLGTLITSFPAVPPTSGVVDQIKDLSITGNGSELYVAYLASRTGAPGSFYPQVRRIDLTSTLGKSIPNIHQGKFGFDYDGMGFTNSCSTPADCSGTQASGVASISFSPSTPTLTGSIVLHTPNGNFTVTLSTSNGVDQICSNCSGATMATQLADLINISTDSRLAGYSAQAVGNVVNIFGSTANDYFDSSAEPISRVAGRMGKIYISGGSWYLPFIDNSLGGSYVGKLSVYSGSTGGLMSFFTEAIIDPVSFPGGGLALMDAAIKFDNYVEGTYLWIAMISSTSGSVGKLYKLDAATFSLIDSDTIFSTDTLLDVQLAASSSRVYVGAQIASGNELKLGIYDINGTSLSEFKMNDAFHIDPAAPLTDDFFNSTSVSSFKIIPYGSEARIFAASRGTTNPITYDYKLYVARLKSVSSSWILSCGDCQTISELGQNISPYVGLGVAPIRVQLGSNYRLGSDGYVSGQGIKDVAFVTFGRLDSAVPGTSDPALGVFNVEPEAISSTTIFDGSLVIPSAPKDAGLYRAPFVKN